MMGRSQRDEGRRPWKYWTGPAVATSGPRSPPRGAFAPSVAFGLGLRMLAAGPAHLLTGLLFERPCERPAKSNPDCALTGRTKAFPGRNSRARKLDCCRDKPRSTHVRGSAQLDRQTGKRSAPASRNDHRNEGRPVPRRLRRVQRKARPPASGRSTVVDSISHRPASQSQPCGRYGSCPEREPPSEGVERLE